MMPSDGFAATFTVPNLHQRLSAIRPVQVYTYQFDAHQAPSVRDDALDLCGTLHASPGVSALPHTTNTPSAS